MDFKVKFSDGTKAFMDIEIHTILTGLTDSEARDMVREFLKGSRYIAAQLIYSHFDKEVILSS